MLEKRKFVRLKSPLRIHYRVIQKNKRSRPQESSLHDISGAGVRLCCKEELRHGDLLKLEIQIPHLDNAVEALGEVVWVAPKLEHRHYEAGVRFRDVNPKDLNKILEYIYTVAIG